MGLCSSKTTDVQVPQHKGTQVQPQHGGAPALQVQPQPGDLQVLPVNPVNAQRPQTVGISLIDEHGIVVDNVRLPIDPLSGRISAEEAYLHQSLANKLDNLNLIMPDRPPFFTRIPDNTPIYVYHRPPSFLENGYGYELNVRLRRSSARSKVPSSLVRSKSDSWKGFSDSRNLSVELFPRNQPEIRDQGQAGQHEGQNQQSIRVQGSNGTTFTSITK